jgi:hypothetical protein
VSENRVLGRILRPKREEVTWRWKKLHIGNVIILTVHQILLRRSNQGECDEHVACMEAMINAYNILV